MFVPVVDKDQKPLMPTKPSRARRWIKKGKATPFWKKGIFCVRLNNSPSAREYQDIAIGVDPGSKREGFTVKSKAHTFLNIQTSTPSWVKNALDLRRAMRMSRRKRTPYRQPRWNRKGGLSKMNLPPSVLVRWQWKLRVIKWLLKLYCAKFFIVEDIKADTRKGKVWNLTFSPLQTGKQWLYSRLSMLGRLILKQGWDTKRLRDINGLRKSNSKLSNVFGAHCVDSWVLANSYVTGHTKPDNTDILLIDPLRFYRRQLHSVCPSKGGVRRPYGGTRSLGFKRGSIVKHPKYGLCYVGGTMLNRITLHDFTDGRRLCRNAKPLETKFIAFCSWRFNYCAAKVR